jgi:hypothetical protein
MAVPSRFVAGEAWRRNLALSNSPGAWHPTHVQDYSGMMRFVPRQHSRMTRPPLTAPSPIAVTPAPRGRRCPRMTRPGLGRYRCYRRLIIGLRRQRNGLSDNSVPNCARKWYSAALQRAVRHLNVNLTSSEIGRCRERMSFAPRSSGTETIVRMVSNVS